ncbi:MAG: ABC transporter ATP-binding protein, partial [Desulfobacteraceae bacterium]|nr:ABC transporter ATP-binding protein [Desulfobacteraceae bacterium]
GLDPNQIREIREIVREIGKEKTVILSTHILSEAEATCDRVVIINKGKIVADGSTESLRQAGNKEHVINLSLLNTDIEAVKNELNSVDGITKIDTADIESPDMLNLKLVCRSTEDLREVIYKKIKQTDWILMDFHQETISLEHIFRELTKEN